MRALVFGASGFVGGTLSTVLRRRGYTVMGSGHTRRAPALVSVDLAQPGAAAAVVTRLRPDIVLHCAGMTDQDACEREPERAERINADASAEIAAATRGVGARMVFFSSEAVFDGTSGPYAETDAVRPVNAYGQTKHRAECLIAAQLPDALILRVSHLFGFAIGSWNTLMRVVTAARAGRPLRLPADQWSTPVDVHYLADATLRLLERGRGGVIHIAGPRYFSRYTLARRVVDALWLPPSTVLPVTTNELQPIAPRLMRGGLRSARLLTEFPACDVDAALVRFVEEATAAERSVAHG